MFKHIKGVHLICFKRAGVGDKFAIIPHEICKIHLMFMKERGNDGYSEKSIF